MSYIIKKLDKDNAKYLTSLITICWNQTYKGLVDDSFLKHLKDTEKEREQHILEGTLDNTFLLDVDGKYVGYLKIQKSENYDDAGEIKCLYLINGYKGYGYGKLLFSFAKDELKKEYQKMIVGCLDGNKSNYFYINMGGKLIGSRKTTFGDIDYKENIYLFDNL